MARGPFHITGNYLQYPGAVVSSLPMTIAGWVYVKVVTNFSYASFVDLHHSGSSDRINFYQLNAYGLNYNSFSPQCSDGGFSSPSESVLSGRAPNGTWHHVGAVFTSSTSRQAFWNGVGGTLNTESQTHSNAPNLTTLGCGVGTPSGAAFYKTDGYLAHMSIWNAALTATEMRALSVGTSPTAIRRGNLKAYWPLYANAPAEDVIGNYDLTQYGTVGDFEEPPILVPRSLSPLRRFTFIDLAAYVRRRRQIYVIS